MLQFKIELSNEGSLKFTFLNGGITTIIDFYIPFTHQNAEYKEFIECVRKFENCDLHYIKYESPYLYFNHKTPFAQDDQYEYNMIIDLTDINKDFCDRFEEVLNDPALQHPHCYCSW